MEMINALGRRKSAVARVYLTEGTGKITINKNYRIFPFTNSSVRCKAAVDIAECS